MGGRGRSRLYGGRGRDRIVGGGGDDAIAGGFANSIIRGGTGNERILAVNGRIDRIDCGPGRDSARVDAGDRVRRCENVKRTD